MRLILLVESAVTKENLSLLTSGLDFIADEFRQERVVRFQAVEEKQERIVPAPFEFVMDSADLLQVAVRVGDETPCA